MEIEEYDDDFEVEEDIVIDLEDEEDYVPAKKEKEEPKEAKAASGAPAAGADQPAPAAAAKGKDDSSESVAAKREDAGLKSEESPAAPPGAAPTEGGAAGCGGEEAAYNPMARISNLKPLPSSSSRTGAISPTSEALMFEPPTEAVRRQRGSSGTTAVAPAAEIKTVVGPSDAEPASASVAKKDGSGGTAAAADAKLLGDEPKFSFGIEGEASSKPASAFDKVQEETFSFELAKAKPIPPPIQTTPKSPVSSAKPAPPATATPRSAGSSTAISPIGAGSSSASGVFHEPSPTKASGNSFGDVPFTPDPQRAPSASGSVGSGGGGKESLDHSFRRTESLNSVGSQRSMRSFMSATPSRGLSVRSGRHASSPGDGDVSDAPFEFPKRLSAEELQQQLAYLEQALRDADRRNTGKLKRQEIQLAVLYSGIETSLPSMLDDLVKLACEQSDTDGSGRAIGISTFLAKLRAAHDTAVDAENMQDAKTALGGLGPELIETIRSRASGDSSTISSATLTSMLTSPPFSLPVEVAESMVKSKGVLSGPGPHGPDAMIDTMRFVARCVPSADEELFAPVRARLMEKYHTMLAAFRAFSRDKKGGSADVKTISKADLTAGIVSLNLGLPDADLDRMCSLADADGNGKIEYQEFSAMFGLGDKHTRKRQEMTVKIAERRHKEKLARVTRFETRVIGLLRRQGAIDLLKEKLAYADDDADGRVSIPSLVECLRATATSGVSSSHAIEFNMEDADTLLRDEGGDAGVEFAQFVDKYAALAESLMGAQARIRDAVRGGEGSMLQGFQRMDAAANKGRQNGRIRTDMLLEALRGLGVVIPTQIGAALMEIADDDKNGWVTYDEFAKMVRGTGAGFGEDTPAAETPDSSRGQRMQWSADGPPSPQSWIVSPVQDGQQREAKVIEAEIRAVLKGRYDTVTSAFQAFDRNKDGFLSRDEAFQALDSMNLGLSKKDITTVIEHVDRNNDGKIDLPEFKDFFGTGVKAEERRKLREDEDAARSKKLKESQRKKATRLVTVGEVATDLSEECETQFWESIQREAATLPEAVMLLKGTLDKQGLSGTEQSMGRTDASDRISEDQFVGGLCKLEFLRSLRACFADGAGGVEDVEALIQLALLPPIETRELLRISGIFSPQDCSALVRKNTPVELLKSGQGGHASLSEDSVYAEGQGRALFKKLCEGRPHIEMPSFVRGLSKWQAKHPDRIDAVSPPKRRSLLRVSAPGALPATRPKHSPEKSRLQPKQKEGGSTFLKDAAPSVNTASSRVSADLEKTTKVVQKTGVRHSTGQLKATGGSSKNASPLLGMEALQEEEARIEARGRAMVQEEAILRLRAKEMEKAEVELSRRVAAVAKREQEVESVKCAADAAKAQSEARLREAFEVTSAARRREAELDKRDADLKRLAEELESLQRSVMKQREIAAKERDAGREQQVKAIVTACEKKVDEARQRREGVTGGRAQKSAAAGKQKQETKGGGGGGGSGTGGGDVAELRAVASLLQSERDGYFERLLAVEKTLQAAAPGLPKSFVDEVNRTLYATRPL